MVVRYGLMELDHLRIAVDRCKEARGYYGLSFFGENDLSVLEIVTVAARPHRWVRVTTHGILRRQGFELRRSGGYNHLVHRFDDRPDDAELRLLAGLFDPPIRNPHPV